MRLIDERLRGVPVEIRSILPTPIHELGPLSDLLGVEIYCKRDDLTGFGLGGNKSRKLDYLLPHAKSKGADTLVAVGANQSNFCRMVAAYGRVNDMEVHLVLGGKRPEKPTGNLLVDHMLGAEIHHVDSMSWDRWEAEAASVEAKLAEQGRKTYRMPVGGSTPIGALGYVQAMSEIMDDEERLGVSFGTIIHASSSGGTQAGLVVGKEIAGWPGRIVGMSVAKDTEAQQRDVDALAGKVGRFLDVDVVGADVIADDAYLGDTYGAKTDQCREAVDMFARKCGIFLDYVYTGKAAAGLIDYARTDRFQKGEKVLFIHTGGNLEIFE
jgi:D-cysteine desulfhydrase family pyridoxal phosphate-dependent enzyme